MGSAHLPPMRDLLLLLETSGPASSVALAQRTGDTWAVLAKAPGEGGGAQASMRHTEQLLPLIRSILPEGGWSRLVAVGTSSGPGSYTGLRAGLSSAKGICLARDVPLLQVSTMRGLTPKPPTPSSRVLVLLPARRDEVYAAVYEGEGLRETFAPAVVQNDSRWREAVLSTGISAVAASEEMLLAGFDASTTKQVVAPLDASNLLWECQVRIAENRYDDLATTVPNYVRPPYITQAKTRL